MFTSYSLQDVMAGLLALLGLVVPIAIHLWNRRPGQTVQVGSVRWLAAAANRRLRNLRLEQVGLLLLRVALLALLALAVAQPLWQRSLPQPLVRGHVLLSPDLLRPDVLPALRPGIDSLRRRGFALQLFAPGFRAVSAQAWTNPDSLAKLSLAPGATALAAGAPVVSPTALVPDDYWARAQQAADSFPDQPLRIVSGAARQHFSGPRPVLPARLTWQTVPLPDSAVWLAGAAVPKAGTLRLQVGRSGEDATTFRVVQLALPRGAAPLSVAGLPELHYQPAQAALPATIELPGRPAVTVAADPLRVVIYADAAHIESARYARAALQAAAIGLPQRLDLTTGSPTTDFAKAAPNWLFWLSDKPAPASWQQQAQRGAQLWQEARAGASVEAELDLTGLATAPPVAISRLDTTATQAAKTSVLVLWQDGTGRPVLTHQASGTGGSYQLATRLQPTWSGLPDSPALPELFLQLLRATQSEAPATAIDLRQLDARQLSASTSLVSQTTSSTAAQQPSGSDAPLTARQVVASTALRPWLVLAALVLFAIERWLAARRTSLTSTSSL
ncbi:BatA domain-containing protein [Hymenobacter sp.]|uniref:BatA domain-containing protein n=1 Tax=Hymenobacter sp. TaxID=1898978 RepID=UPI002EDA8521